MVSFVWVVNHHIPAFWWTVFAAVKGLALSGTFGVNLLLSALHPSVPLSLRLRISLFVCYCHSFVSSVDLSTFTYLSVIFRALVYSPYLPLPKSVELNREQAFRGATGTLPILTNPSILWQVDPRPSLQHIVFRKALSIFLARYIHTFDNADSESTLQSLEGNPYDRTIRPTHPR